MYRFPYAFIITYPTLTTIVLQWAHVVGENTECNENNSSMIGMRRGANLNVNKAKKRILEQHKIARKEKKKRTELRLLFTQRLPQAKEKKNNFFCNNSLVGSENK